MLHLFNKAIENFANLALYVFGAMALALLALIVSEEGLSGIRTHVIELSQLVLKFIPILAVFFSMTTSLNHLQKKHPEAFRQILDGERGTAPMVLLSMIMPGPAGAGQIKKGWEDNLSANIPPKEREARKEKLLYALVGMMGLGVNIYIFRAKLLGGPLVMIWTTMPLFNMAWIWLFFRIRYLIWFR